MSSFCIEKVMSSNTPTSEFGIFPKYGNIQTASIALGLAAIANPEGIRFSNGTNVWRIRMEIDNNLVFSFSNDGGENFTAYHVFSPN